MLTFLRQEGISEDIVREIEAFRARYPLDDASAYRVPDPSYRYYGKDIWEMALTALLSGENLLLVGPKATGKNVLAENLAAVFCRPEWDISFYLNTDAASLIGTSGSLMRSTWQKTNLLPCSMPHSTFDGSSTFRDMTASHSVPQRALSLR